MPYSQITVKVIIDEAECNRSTFYEYFDSTDDLYNQAQQQLIDDVREYLRAYYADVRDKNYQEIFGLAANTYGENSDKLDLILGSACSFITKSNESLRPAILELFGLSSDSAKNNFAADMISFSWLSTLSMWNQEGRPISEEDLAKLLIGWTTEGIIPTMQELSSSKDDSGPAADAPADSSEPN